MKRRIPSRVVSTMLLLAIAVSMFTVFTSAPVSAAEANSNIVLFYNRAFDEGWGLDNGLTLTPKSNKIILDSKRNEMMEYNYFFRITVGLKDNGAAEDGYVQLNVTGASHTADIGSVMEFDIMTETKLDIGRIMYAMGKDSNFYISYLYTKNNKLYAFSEDESGYLCDLDAKWRHIAIIHDYDDPSLAKNKTRVTIVASDDKGNGRSVTRDMDIAPADAKLSYVRIGLPGGERSKNAEGQTYCLDNLKLYTETDQIVEIPESKGYGVKVNTSSPKTEVIIKDSGVPADKTDWDYIMEGLNMKVGVNQCLLRGERTPILTDSNGASYGAPVKAEDGTVMVPLEALTGYTGYEAYIHPDGTYIDIPSSEGAAYICIGKDTATVNGERLELTAAPAVVRVGEGEQERSYVVVAMDDVEALFKGYYVTYDDMGLIIVCKKDEVANRDTSLSTLTAVMKLFVFDNPSPEQVMEDVEAATEGFDHPYIYADQETFDFMHESYVLTPEDEGYDSTYHAVLRKFVNNSENNFKTYCLPSGVDAEGNPTYDEYVGMDPAMKPIQPYAASNGYDPDGGRLNEISSLADVLQILAAGYHITKNVKYAYFAYDFALALGEWLHWGPGHFLNCADGTAPFAIYYDWCYDINEELGLDNDVLAEILFEKGVYQGYLSSTFTYVERYRIQGNASNYTDRTNNWVAVCASGMITGALAILGEAEYAAESSWLISDNIYWLGVNGLEQYAPDGAYIEGPTYWAYGTNNFFDLCYALDCAAGTNYGLMEAWGIYDTCYYACNVESNEFKYFNYHDSTMSSIGSQWFMYVGAYFNDPGLTRIRVNHLKSGKSYQIPDLFCYPTFADGAGESEMGLDYLSTGIDLYTARSSWEKGAVFVAVIGGNNDVSHGQVDAGDFVYHNGGTIWFTDPGTEDYNTHGFWTKTGNRYRYYLMSPEGNNTLVLSSDIKNVPHGQVASATVEAYGRMYNDYGSGILMDMTPALGPNTVKATRGVMLTNDRKTTVIQDEISFSNIQSVHWFAHYDSANVSNVTLSSDRRTAYLTSANGMLTLRAKIVSNTKSFVWSIMDAYTYVLTDPDTGTLPVDYAPNHGMGVPEKDRTHLGKLCITGKNVLSFNVAVVIELVNPDEEIGVGYSWTVMDNWNPTADTRGADDIQTADKLRADPKKSEINSAVARLDKYKTDGTLFTTGLDSYYRLITDVEYVRSYFDGGLTGQTYESLLARQDEYLAGYVAYIEDVNDSATRAREFLRVLSGI